MSSWIILPTYNEAANVAQMVGALSALDAGLNVLVVDDDSPDGTGAIAAELSTRHPSLHVIRRRGERGLGTAYLTGFREAIGRGGERLLTMDCDFSHDPASIPGLLAASARADLVIGSRYVPGGTIRGWPTHRRLISRAANLFVHAFFHLSASDCTSGFRLYRRHVVEAIPWNRVRSTGYSFLVETLLWASRQDGVRVAELPICFRDRERGKSKLGWREAVLGARNLIRLWWELSG